MAKLARNRGMFFGSWTGTAITEAATATETGSSITAVSVTASTFGTAVSGVSGIYVFTYDGTNWKYNGTTVTLSSYGLEITGTAAASDTITVDYTAASGGWEALGKDDDDLSKELNADTETKKNVLGESSFEHRGYETEISMDSYYMDPSRIMYDHLLEIALQEKYSEEDCIGCFAEAFFTTVNEQAGTMSGYCFVRKAWFVPQSVGGDTSGYQIPFNINPIGPMTKKAITYNMSTNIATITAIS